MPPAAIDTASPKQMKVLDGCCAGQIVKELSAFVAEYNCIIRKNKSASSADLKF